MEQTISVPQSVWERLADPALKLAFAGFLAVKPDSPQGRFEAARLTMPNEPENSFLIFQIADQWPNDVLVIAERDRLSRITPTETLPTVEQTAREVYNLAIDNSKSVRERLDAYRLYGELRQMIGKGNGTVVNNNILNDNRGVYVVPARVTDQAAFQLKAVEQQARLSGAKSTAS